MIIESAKVVNKTGALAFEVNGKVIAPFMFALTTAPGAHSYTEYGVKNIKSFAKSGINIVSINAYIGKCWHKSSGYNFSSVTEEILGVIDVNPNAMINIRLHLDAPYWWLRDNPEECVLYRHSDGDFPGVDDGEIPFSKNDDIRASIGSLKWKREAGDAVRSLCEVLDSCEAGQHVLSIQVAYGTCGEWHNFGCDVSEPMKDLFHRYIIKKYKTEDNLQKAYGTSKVDFRNAEFHPELFRKEDSETLLDPKTAMNRIDSRYVHQKCVTDAILYFADIVKKTFTRDIIVGTFYGYFVGVAGQTTVEGHCLEQEIFKHNDLINFLAGPMPYGKNRRPECPPVQRGLLESCRLNNVLWLTEMDQRPEGLVHGIEGDSDYDSDTIAIMKRNIFQDIMAGQGAWYFDHRIVEWADKRFDENGRQIPLSSRIKSIYRKIGWWERPILQKEIEKMNVFARDFFDHSYKPKADVLLVFDNSKYFYANPIRKNEEIILAKLSKTGTAYDNIFLSDLDKCDKERYKCVFFFVTPYLTAETKALIKDFSKGRTAVFFENVAESDGITVSLENVKNFLGIDVKPADHPSFITDLNGEKTDIEYSRVYNLLAVEKNEDCKAMSYYDNGEIASVQFGNNFYCCYPDISQSEINAIIDASGAFRYISDGSVAMAAGDYVVIYSFTDGIKDIKFQNGKNIKVDIPAFNTAIIDSVTGKQIL